MATSKTIDDTSSLQYDLVGGDTSFIFQFYEANKLGIDIYGTSISGATVAVSVEESNSPDKGFVAIKDVNDSDNPVVLTLDAGTNNNAINIHSFTKDYLKVVITANGNTGTIDILPTDKNSR